MTLLRFGDFTLDHPNRQLWRGDELIPLEPKVFDFVALLAGHCGQLLKTEVIRQTLWPNVTVGPGALRRVVNAARAALGDRGNRQAMIRTRRGYGWELVVPVSPVSRPESEHASMTPVPWRFIGRAVELAQLAHAAREASRGTGSMILVTGEAGVGKSALLSELRNTHGVATWLEGACNEDPGTPMCWPFRSMAGVLAQRPRVRRTRQEDELLVPVFPELVADAPRHGVEPDAEQRFLACHAFARLLGRMAQEAPLHLIVEDFHSADVGTLLVLEALVHVVRKHALFVCVSYRPEVLPAQRALSQSIERIRHRERVFSVELPRLSTHQADELVRGTGVSADAARSIVGRAAGVPLLLRELTRQHLLSGGPENSSSEPDLVLLVAERAALLPESARHILQRAAILGRAFELDRLASMSGLSRQRVEDDLGAAIDWGWVTRSRESATGFEFTHERLHAALSYELTNAQRRARHAEAWASYPADTDSESELDAMAAHAYRANSCVSAEERARCCERAGLAALRALHFERAAVHLGRALELRQSAPASPELAELALAYARALWEADREFDAVRGAFSHAADIARTARDSLAFARAAIGCACGQESLASARAAGFHADPIALLTEAIEMLRGDASPAATQIMHRAARTACWLHTASGDYARADDSARLALSCAPLPDDPWSLVLTQGLRCARSLWARDLGEARTRLIALARQSGSLDDERRRIDAELQVMVMALVVGDTEVYRSAQERLARAVASLPPPVASGRVGVRLATQRLLPYLAQLSRAVCEGAFARADAALAELRAAGLQLALPPSREGSDNLHALLACSFGYRSVLRMLQPMVDDFALRFPDSVSTLCVVRAQIAVESGDFAAARCWWDESRERGFQIEVGGRPMLARTELRVRLSDVCARIGTSEDAAFLYASLAPGKDMAASYGPFVTLGSVARPLGALALRCGQTQLAVEHFEQAVRENTRIGHLPELVRSRAGLARGLLAVGRTQQALMMRSAACSQAEQLGMSALILRELDEHS